MFRSVTSVVSALSGCGANGHQTMQHVSSSPSKIPYDGFSPVRLQTGRPRQPSTHGPGLSAKPACPRCHRVLYAAQVFSPVQNSSARTATPHCAPRSRPDGQAVFWPFNRTLQPRGPSLPRGLCCPAGSPLLWPHLRLSAPSTGLFSSSRRVPCPLSSFRRGTERVPNLMRVSLLSVPPPVPRWTSRLHLAVPWPPVLAFALFAGARHPHVCARRFSASAQFVSRGCRVRFMLRPGRLLALHRQGRLRPSFLPTGSPPPEVGYDYMAYNQLPWPDFHRLDTRPYGLRTKSTKLADARNPRETAAKRHKIRGGV